MSTDAMYTAMREFIREAVKVEVLKADAPRSTLISELRTKLDEMQGRAVPITDHRQLEDRLKKAQDEIAELRSLATLKPKDGKDGEDGKDGKDGIATREELDAWFDQRAADLEARGIADSYDGVYEAGKDYKRSKLVTWGGSLWLSLVETRARPGESTDWRLIVKAGRDGKK